MQQEKPMHTFKEGQRVNGRFRLFDELEQALEDGYFEFECIETVDYSVCTVFYIITQEQDACKLRKYRGVESLPLSLKGHQAASLSNEISDINLYSLVSVFPGGFNLRPFRWYPNATS